MRPFTLAAKVDILSNEPEVLAVGLNICRGAQGWLSSKTTILETSTKSLQTETQLVHQLNDRVLSPLMACNKTSQRAAIRAKALARMNRARGAETTSTFPPGR